MRSRTHNIMLLLFISISYLYETIRYDLVNAPLYEPIRKWPKWRYFYFVPKDWRQEMSGKARSLCWHYRKFALKSPSIASRKWWKKVYRIMLKVCGFLFFFERKLYGRFKKIFFPILRNMKRKMTCEFRIFYSSVVLRVYISFFVRSCYFFVFRSVIRFREILGWIFYAISQNRITPMYKSRE